jgi:hypothetical protein
MGRDCLYDLLGVVWLSDGEEYRERLVKEALKRGSGEERQRYSQLEQRKTAIFQRLAEISAAELALNLRDAQNVLPPEPTISHAPDKPSKTLGLPRPDPSRSRRNEADLDAKRQQYTLALKACHDQDSAVLSERLKLMSEILALQSQYAALEEDEKWLLLSMVIKNQSSLLGYMQIDDKK